MKDGFRKNGSGLCGFPLFIDARKCNLRPIRKNPFAGKIGVKFIQFYALVPRTIRTGEQSFRNVCRADEGG